MGIGFHLDDVDEAYFSEKLGYEMPREPKFYSDNNFTPFMDRTKTLNLRVPSGQRVIYEANDEGIVKVTETFGQDGESLYRSNEMIIPKEIFVAAYEKYIKDGER